MDQPKISRILRLIVLLSGNCIYTEDELAAEPDGKTVLNQVI